MTARNPHLYGVAARISCEYFDTHSSCGGWLSLVRFKKLVSNANMKMLLLSAQDFVDWIMDRLRCLMLAFG